MSLIAREELITRERCSCAATKETSRGEDQLPNPSASESLRPLPKSLPQHAECRNESGLRAMLLES